MAFHLNSLINIPKQIVQSRNATTLQARKPANAVFRSRREREEGKKERRIKVVVVVVGGVETVENLKIPQKPVPEGLFGVFGDNPDRKSDPETV